MFYNILNDFFTLFTTQDDHRSFRRQLEAKRPVIETNLISGRQHVANEPPVSDISDNEGNLQSFLAHISPGEYIIPYKLLFLLLWFGHSSVQIVYLYPAEVYFC